MSTANTQLVKRASPEQVRKLMRFTLKVDDINDTEDYTGECSEVDGVECDSETDEDVFQASVINKILNGVLTVTPDDLKRTTGHPSMPSEPIEAITERVLPEFLLLYCNCSYIVRLTDKHSRIECRNRMYLVPKADEHFKAAYSILEMTDHLTWSEDLPWCDIEECNPPYTDSMTVEERVRLLFALIGECPRRYWKDQDVYKRNDPDDEKSAYPLPVGEMQALADICGAWDKYEIKPGAAIPAGAVYYEVKVEDD